MNVCGVSVRLTLSGEGLLGRVAVREDRSVASLAQLVRRPACYQTVPGLLLDRLLRGETSPGSVSVPGLVHVLLSPGLVQPDLVLLLVPVIRH